MTFTMPLLRWSYGSPLVICPHQPGSLPSTEHCEPRCWFGAVTPIKLTLATQVEVDDTQRAFETSLRIALVTLQEPEQMPAGNMLTSMLLPCSEWPCAAHL